MTRLLRRRCCSSRRPKEERRNRSLEFIYRFRLSRIYLDTSDTTLSRSQMGWCDSGLSMPSFLSPLVVVTTRCHTIDFWAPFHRRRFCSNLFETICQKGTWGFGDQGTSRVCNLSHVHYILGSVGRRLMENCAFSVNCSIDTFFSWWSIVSGVLRAYNLGSFGFWREKKYQLYFTPYWPCVSFVKHVYKDHR